MSRGKHPPWGSTFTVQLLSFLPHCPAALVNVAPGAGFSRSFQLVLVCHCGECLDIFQFFMSMLLLPRHPGRAF
ncbi:hypothetical protein FB451DRAFT_675554 [Mycena latifolia]|nr:hypothetical protein FB451DRAFT_675554 [Mycena latifolia]